MRVNISYSVDLEEVPSEVDKLLEECETIFRGVCGKFGSCARETPLETIQNLNDIRLGLKAADIRLSECSQILSGYVEIKANIPISPSPGDIEREEGNDDKKV